MTNLVTCPRCEGKAVLPWLLHVDDGVCYQCAGTGEVAYIVSDLAPFKHLLGDVSDVVHTFMRCIEGETFYYTSTFVQRTKGLVSEPEEMSLVALRAKYIAVRNTLNT